MQVVSWPLPALKRGLFRSCVLESPRFRISVSLDVWLVYRLSRTGKMWRKNSSCTLLVEHGAWETLCFGQDMARSPPWTASFNMRMENFWLLERLFINYNKSLSRIVGLESIGGQDGWVGWVCRRSFVPWVPISQAVFRVWSPLFIPRAQNRVSLRIFWFSCLQNSERVYASSLLFYVCPPFHLNWSAITSVVLQTCKGLLLFLTALVSLFLFRTWTVPNSLGVLFLFCDCGCCCCCCCCNGGSPRTSTLPTTLLRRKDQRLRGREKAIEATETSRDRNPDWSICLIHKEQEDREGWVRVNCSRKWFVRVIGWSEPDNFCPAIYIYIYL